MQLPAAACVTRPARREWLAKSAHETFQVDGMDVFYERIEGLRGASIRVARARWWRS
jgi:hypothetical protein